MTRDELIEKVARTICQNPPLCACDDMRISCCSKSAHEASRAAVDIVLEEAAKVATAAINSCREDGESDLRAARSRVQSAIRALKSGDGE